MVLKKSSETMLFTRWIFDLDWRHRFLIFPPLCFIIIIIILFLSSTTTTTTKSLFFSSNQNPKHHQQQQISPSPPPPPPPPPSSNELTQSKKTTTKSLFFSSNQKPKHHHHHHHHHQQQQQHKHQQISPPPPPPPTSSNELTQSKIAICLVGGARRFELTGPSIIKNLIQVYPNSNLFLHSPLDKDSYKFSLLKSLPRTTQIAAIRIFNHKPLPETESQLRVLTASNSPNGIQGLLQYFNLVEGCLSMIKSHQLRKNFTYDWIIRSRVDGYWSAPLGPKNFIPGVYVAPSGSSYEGLNDRLGIGDLNTSTVALSRLSLIPQLDSAAFYQLNSEASFKAQLTTQGVNYTTKRFPFCIVTDRKYSFPPVRLGVPVASLSSRGPLSGAKCRPCTPKCVGQCVGSVMKNVFKWWSWTDWENGSLELCDAHSEWEPGWERIFDNYARKKSAGIRKRINTLSLKECVNDFDEMRKRTVVWDAPSSSEICRLGLEPK